MWVVRDISSRLDASGGRNEMSENAVLKDLGFVVAKLQCKPGYERLLLMSPSAYEHDGTPVPAQSFALGGRESLLQLHELLSVLIEGDEMTPAGGGKE